MMAGLDEEQIRDIDYMLSMGELFTLVVYGHLVLEKALMENTDPDLLNQVFDVFVRDFSAYATDLHGKPGNTDAQRALIRELIMAPAANPDQFERVWRERVYALNGQYEMVG
jgi:acyl-CoA dehydrogenase